MRSAEKVLLGEGIVLYVGQCQQLRHTWPDQLLLAFQSTRLKCWAKCVNLKMISFIMTDVASDKLMTAIGFRIAKIMFCCLAS